MFRGRKEKGQPAFIAADLIQSYTGLWRCLGFWVSFSAFTHSGM